MSYQLKRLTEGSVAAALDKAEKYRDLNQPDEAESICRDILDVSPANPGALRTLGLSLTDRFATGSWATHFDEAVASFARLPSEYERVYYTGIAWERCAKAQVEHGEAHNAVNSFEEALGCFELAERLAPTDTPDPVLRWNRCVRALTTDARLIEAQATPMDAGVVFGD